MARFQVAKKTQALYSMEGYEWHDRPGRGCALGGGRAKHLDGGGSPRAFLCAKRFCG